MTSSSLRTVALFGALVVLVVPCRTVRAYGSITLNGKRHTITRQVVGFLPNKIRSEYSELKLRDGEGDWFFRGDVHAGIQRTQNELAYYHTSRDLGLHVVPKLVAASWNNRSGSVQRLVPGTQRSSGSIHHDIALVRANAHVDWDSVHALAIQHYVTTMHDDSPDNVLMSRAADGRLRYHAIDGERTFGRTRGFARYRVADSFVRSSFRMGGPAQLSPELWARIRSTDIERWKQHLAADGVSAPEIERAVGKLKRVQELGLSAL